MKKEIDIDDLLTEGFDFQSVFGGVFGGFVKDIYKDMKKSNVKISNDVKNIYTGNELIDIQRMFIAQKVLTGEASAWVRKQMRNIGILREWEKRDLSGYVRLVHGKIREEIERGKSLINIERLLFK